MTAMEFQTNNAFLRSDLYAKTPKYRHMSRTCLLLLNKLIYRVFSDNFTEVENSFGVYKLKKKEQQWERRHCLL